MGLKNGVFGSGGWTKYMHLKGLVRYFQKMVLLIMLRLTVSQTFKYKA